MRVHARLLRSVIDIARGVCSLQISIEPVSFRGIGRDDGTAAHGGAARREEGAGRFRAIGAGVPK